LNGLWVEASRPAPGKLALRYRAEGRIADIKLPAPAKAARTDELWERTCFEAFLREGDDEGYYEFNLAPSTNWQAYRFSGYRKGRREAGEVAKPRIECEVTRSHFELRAAVELGLMARGRGRWRLALSVVIEEIGGAKSYWALAHPPGKPDFHHADGFAFDIPA
jgi:hypothetical protein